MGHVDKRRTVGTRAAGDLCVKEEEKFGVLQRRDFPERDRTADISTELVKTQLCFGRSKWGASVECIIAQKFIGRSVKSSSAALGRRRYQDARISPMLGAEIAVLNFELADRIQAHLCKLTVIRSDVGIDRAIEINVIGCVSQ